MLRRVDRAVRRPAVAGGPGVDQRAPLRTLRRGVDARLAVPERRPVPGRGGV